LTTLLPSISRTDKEAIVQALAAKATKRLSSFCQFVDPTYCVPPHIQTLCDALDKVERGEIKRLMIFMPPRHGKSETVSRKFPAYYLGKHPNENVILTSYGYILAKSFSRATRDLMESRRFKAIYPVRTAHDARSVNDWDIAGARGGFLAAGVGGATTGYGADLFIIDDPIKNKEEADSEIIREKHWDWYRSVVLTRLEPNAKLVLMMTRWHQQDLAGKILAQAREDGELDEWTIINFPAIAEENDSLGRKVGEVLWSFRYPTDVLKSIRTKVGSRIWFALFQGQPQDPETQIFKREWFKWYREIPIEHTRHGGIDTATSLQTSADYMSLVDVVKDWEGYLYLDDVFLDKLSVYAFAKHVNAAHAAKNYKRIKLESNNAGDAVKQRIVEVGREPKTGSHPPVESVVTSTDKVVRANEWAHLVENGTLKFKLGNKKVAQLVEHLVNFDGKGSDIDDDVDASGFAVKSATGGAVAFSSTNDFDVFAKGR
jgi:predicted phage terminase large subunit-like protein